MAVSKKEILALHGFHEQSTVYLLPKSVSLTDAFYVRSQCKDRKLTDLALTFSKKKKGLF